jgi:prolyl 4-hydroxylase
MKDSRIDPEWEEWVKFNKESGCELIDLFNIMVKNDNDIHGAFNLVFNQMPETYHQKSWFNPNNKNHLICEDQKIDILLHMNSPEVVLFNNFLNDMECEELIALSEKRLVYSKVVDSKTGTNVLHPDRTSNNAHYKLGENELIQLIELRISQLLNIPMAHGEGLQVLNYPPEKEYKSHYDYFSPKNGESSHLRKGGQRVGTFIMYLSDVEEGGETTFPYLNMKIIPKKGNALFFSYANDIGQLDKRSLHAGNPVISGNKWIATKWIRQNPTK